MSSGVEPSATSGTTIGAAGAARGAPTRRPTDLAEAAAALADSAGKVLIRGAGTAADWAGTPDPPDLVLDTTALSGVLTHNPADMTVAVRAGTPLRELNEMLAEHRQRVALDPARVALGATLGGLVATADSGPRALVYGSARDLMIGATLVLSDGTVARTGGHVIKNVAGYDLAKLVHGCHGTLALIAELVLRLHPLPAASATGWLPGSLAEVTEAVTRLLGSPLEPVAVEWSEWRGGGLLVRLEGRPEAVDARMCRLTELLGLGATRLDPTEATEAWHQHADQVSGARGRPPAGRAVLRVGVRPSRLAGLLDRFTAELAADRVTAGLATGVGTAALPADPDVIARAHQLTYEAGGVSTLRSRPADAILPAWGPTPSSVRLLHAVRSELDPDSRLGAGRFAPWL
jgi:glycolate oxidase FAD binding subunit